MRRGFSVILITTGCLMSLASLVVSTHAQDSASLLTDPSLENRRSFILSANVDTYRKINAFEQSFLQSNQLEDILTQNTTNPSEFYPLKTQLLKDMASLFNELDDGYKIAFEKNQRHKEFAGFQWKIKESSPEKLLEQFLEKQTPSREVFRAINMLGGYYYERGDFLLAISIWEEAKTIYFDSGLLSSGDKFQLEEEISSASQYTSRSQNFLKFNVVSDHLIFKIQQLEKSREHTIISMPVAIEDRIYVASIDRGGCLFSNSYNQKGVRIKSTLVSTQGDDGNLPRLLEKEPWLELFLPQLQFQFEYLIVNNHLVLNINQFEVHLDFLNRINTIVRRQEIAYPTETSKLLSDLSKIYLSRDSMKQELDTDLTSSQTVKFLSEALVTIPTSLDDISSLDLLDKRSQVQTGAAKGFTKLGLVQSRHALERSLKALNGLFRNVSSSGPNPPPQ